MESYCVLTLKDSFIHVVGLNYVGELLFLDQVSEPSLVDNFHTRSEASK